MIAGASLAVIPSITDNTKYWYSVLIYTSNNVPAGLSYVAKEYYFKASVLDKFLFDEDDSHNLFCQNLDIFYLTTFVSWIQLVISWVFVPILAIPGFGGVSLEDIPSIFKDGFLCFIGDSSIPVTGGTQNYCSSTFLSPLSLPFSHSLLSPLSSPSNTFLPSLSFSFFFPLLLIPLCQASTPG